MKDNKLYTLVYAAVLGIVCSGLLTGVGMATKDRIAANKEAERVRNILNVLSVPFEHGASSQELVQIFKDRVEETQAGELEEYRLTDNGQLEAVAIPFEGQGVWGPVRGFLSLEPDMRTIRGITFHEQEETPGLGGEIGAEWFTKQFEGKKIVVNGRPGIHVRPNGVADPNGVDAITGATMTSGKVEAMLNDLIARIVKEGAHGN